MAKKADQLFQHTRSPLNVMTILVTTLILSSPARAASLDVYADVVGGAGNGCSTFGPEPALSGFFTFTGQTLPLGGVSGCGYSGGMSHLTAASGPLTSTNSVESVILGNPGYSGYFAGTAKAVANYGQLGAAVHANISGGISGSPLALLDTVHAQVTQFSLSPAPGTNYINTAQESQSLVLMFLGLGLLGLSVRRKN